MVVITILVLPTNATKNNTDTDIFRLFKDIIFNTAHIISFKFKGRIILFLPYTQTHKLRRLWKRVEALYKLTDIQNLLNIGVEIRSSYAGLVCWKTQVPSSALQRLGRVGHSHNGRTQEVGVRWSVFLGYRYLCQPGISDTVSQSSKIFIDVRLTMHEFYAL